ncbi:MAG: hypothetical protein KA715_03705 [Xanthomonadaceae bacterium]|nr:hypothetical protein [Xanthomonadaceae bacterium]
MKSLMTVMSVLSLSLALSVTPALAKKAASAKKAGTKCTDCENHKKDTCKCAEGHKEGEKCDCTECEDCKGKVQHTGEAKEHAVEPSHEATH